MKDDVHYPAYDTAGATGMCYQCAKPIRVGDKIVIYNIHGVLVAEHVRCYEDKK